MTATATPMHAAPSTAAPDAAAPLVSFPGEGEAVAARGRPIATIKVDSRRTGGAWSLVEMTVPPGFAGPPPHRHAQLTETFYVLRGTVTFLVGDERVRATPGTCVVVPPGTRHAFDNPDAEPASFLQLGTPGGHEDFFRDLAALLEAEPAWPPRDPAVLRALGERHDTVYEQP